MTRNKRPQDRQRKRGDRIADGFSMQQMVVLPPPVVRNALAANITCVLLPTDIGFFPAATSHYIDRRVGIPQAILICCVAGEGWAQINGRRSVIRPGNVLIVPPHQPHSYGAAEHRPWTIYWCHVAGSSVAHLLSVLGVRSDGPNVLDGPIRTLIPLFEQVTGTLKAGYDRKSLLMASLTIGHVLGVLIVGQRDGTTGDDLNERLVSTIELMRQQVFGRVTGTELAAMAGLSPSHFAVLFKRKTGYAVQDYFTRLKMQEACSLLDLTTLPINTIARRMGYDDALYFSRVFRKVMAMPPRRYRALRKG